MGILDNKKIRFGIKVFWFRDVLSKFGGNQLVSKRMPRYIGNIYKHQKALLGIARKGGGVGCGENLLGSMKDIGKS